MTTRRRLPAAPPPPRGRSGRFGLPPLAIRLTSVDAPERGIDPHGDAQRLREASAGTGPLEAAQVAARVHAAARLVATGDELAVADHETDEVALLRTPAAAGAAPNRLHDYSDSGTSDSTSTGIPAGISSSGATSASGASVSIVSGSSDTSTCSDSGPTLSGSGALMTFSSSGSDSATIGSSSSGTGSSASAWCAGTPQKRDPGSAAFGQRLPFARIALQRPDRSCSSPPPPNATSASACANSESLWMSIFHPVRRAARRA